MPMTALPTVEQVRTRRLLPIDDATAFSLYTSYVLPAQNAANGPGNEMELMYSRVIGYLVLYAPSDTARGELKMAMASCNNNSSPFGFLYRLGEYYLKNLIVICKSHSVFSSSRRLRFPTPLQSENIGGGLLLLRNIHPALPSIGCRKQ